jgi:anti-sigma regulatory factor (Ser/Thr protein kinase)
LEVSPVLQGAAAQIRHVIDEDSQVGQVRRSAQALAASRGFTETDVGRVAIVATELANNLVRHARGGELLLQPIASTQAGLIELLAIDRGRGMADVERCMKDGYSSTGTAGTGLGAVRRLATEFDIHSTPGQGTIVMARVGAGAPAHFGAISIPIAGEFECGDCWRVALQGEERAVIVADGLGHGIEAAAAAGVAAEVFAAAPFDEPSSILERAHRAMSGSRGAAVACARLRPASSLVYAGIGNISGALLGTERRQGLVSHNGILGVRAHRVQQFEYRRDGRSLLVMHSDGISARWDLEPAVASRHPAIIAALLYRDHARGRDDASVVVSNG